ncbi:acyltransferase domain-containing protein [Nocardiopsis sediminis]|uniref:Acyltransferase domain-containing protein n=1 Tax=Nocardiopsis sediminis TaxID=1778267 RepID=A0ABV8FQQ6_9ACTN
MPTPSRDAAVPSPAPAVPRPEPAPAGRPVALLFPGQGAQHGRMAAGLYDHCPVFTATMDRAFALLGRDGDLLRAEWLSDEEHHLFDDVSRAQPLLYAVDYALGRMVLEWGVAPVALLGHSVGEMAAATLAGVIDFADGMLMMRDRIAAFSGGPPGGMLAVAAPAADLAPYLSGQVVVGAVNAPWQTLLAGPAAGLEAARTALRADGITCRPARARQAFHSPMLAAAARATARAWAAIPLRAPELTVYSARLGGVLGAGDARSPGFWAAQPAEPVLFWPALDRLLGDHDVLLVEAGPGQGLSALARRHPAVSAKRSAVAPLLPARPRGAAADRAAVARAADLIRAEGHLPDPLVARS